MLQLDIHLRGDRPSGLPFLLGLRNIGIQTVLNLERGYLETFKNVVNQEVEWVIQAGLRPVHIEFGDIMAPTRQEMDAALMVLVDNARFGPVYVHCLEGKNRTGMVCAYYRVKHDKWSVDAAIQEMLGNGFREWVYGPLQWISTLREYCSD